MAVNEAEILQKLQADKNLGKDPKDVYIDAITVLSDEIVENYKNVIDKTTKSDSGTLKQSVTAIPSRNGFSIEADYYFKFIDQGVSGVGNVPGRRIRPIVQNSPFKFKNKFVPRRMASSIREWSGAPMEQAYAIGVNIKTYGIKPQNISEQAVSDEVLDRISEDLATITGLVVEVTFDQAFDDVSE